MKKGLFTLLLLLITALPAWAAPTNTTGPWGIDIATFTSISSAKRSPATAGKTMVITKAMDCGDLTIPEDRAVDVKMGGRIRYSGNLVINGPFTAGFYQALEKVGSGTIKFGPGAVSKVPPHWWGAKGDAITNCSPAFQEAARVVDEGSQAFYLPVGRYRIPTKISFLKPPNIIGDAYSPPVVDTGFTPRGVVLLCEVPDDYAMDINNTAVYIQGLDIQNVHFLASGAGSAGAGLNIVNCGWGGHTKGVVIEGFARTGLRLSQVQDSQMDQIEILKCGTDNVYPALHITNGSNLINFTRARLELNMYTMLVDANCFGIEFHNSHIEQGDYPGALFGSYYQVIPRYSSIRILNSKGVKFIGGNISAATLASTMAEYSITADQAPYLITTSNATDLKFIGTTMGSGWDRGKILDLNGDGAVVGCTFQFLTVETPSIRLVGNIQFTNNNLPFTDVAGNLSFHGIYGEGALVKDNYLMAQNVAMSDKTSGSLFSSTASNRMKVGHNVISIAKRHFFHDGNSVVWAYQPTDVQVADFTGVLDSRLYDFHMLFVPSVTGSLTAISNPAVNQVVTISNFVSGGGFDFTVVHSNGTMQLKGGVNAVLTKYKSITLQYEGINGTTNEISRNF